MPDPNTFDEYKDAFENLILTDAPTYNGKYSIKTNLTVIFNYLKSLKGILQTFYNYMIYLKSQINAEDIVNNVTQNIMINKINFEIEHTQPTNTVEIYNVQDILYKVNKIRDNEYEISKDTNDWNVDNLFVDVKNVNGEKIYPIITTANNRVNIIFSEATNLNFKVILL